MKKILLFITLLTIVAFPQERIYKGTVKVDSLRARTIMLNGKLLTPGGSVGNADSLGSIPANRYALKIITDSLAEDIANTVDKTSTQTITGQKTFSSTNTIVHNILPEVHNFYGLGSNTKQFDNIYAVRWFAWIGTSLNEVRWVSTTGPRQILLPDKNGTVTLLQDTVNIIATKHDLTQIEAGVPILPDSIVYTSEIANKVSITQLSDSLAKKLNKNFGATLPNNNEIRTDDYLVTYDTQDIQLEATSMADLPISSATQTALNTKLNANAVRDSIDQYMADSSVTSNYTAAEIDSAAAIAYIFRNGTATEVTQPNGLDVITAINNETGNLETIKLQNLSTSTTFSNVAGLQDTINALHNQIAYLISLMQGLNLSDNTPPLAPTNLVATADNDTAKIRLTWTDPTAPDLDSIRIYRAVIADTTVYTYLTRVAKGVQSYTNTGLAENTAYWYKLKAVDDSSNVSTYSNRDSAKTFTSGSSFTPANLHPVVQLVYDTGVTADAQNKVSQWTDGDGVTFIDDYPDTNYTPLKTDSSIFFTPWTTDPRLYLSEANSDSFLIGTGDFSLEMWVYLKNTGRTFERSDGSDDYWYMDVMAADDCNLSFEMYDFATTTTASFHGSYMSAVPLAPKWYHLVVSVDRSVGITTFVDSVSAREWTTEWTNMASNTIDPTGYTRMLAKGNQVATIRWYNYALTPEDVKNLYIYGITHGHR